MKKNPGKLDCTRISLRCRSRLIQILLLVLLSAGLTVPLRAQSLPTPYPEVARLGASSYCNSFFGFRMPMPAEMRIGRYHLPVQPPGKHLLLALNFSRLDRAADLYVSAFEDASPDAAHLAARARLQQFRRLGMNASAPPSVMIAGRESFRVRKEGDAATGDESSYYLAVHGWVLHFEIRSQPHGLESDIAAAVEHLSFFDPAAPGVACANDPIYYGPALPTALVDETIGRHPGERVPAGELLDRTFAAPAIGLRVQLPPRWRPLSREESEKLPELLAEAEPNRRHELLRACSRVLFGAIDPLVEPVSGVHPSLEVMAMPRGCVPDLIPPTPEEGREQAMDFADVLLHSLGFRLSAQWRVHAAPGAYHLDGFLPYHVPEEALARRLSLRVSVVPTGDYLLLFYSVTTSAAEQRKLEAGISLAAGSESAK
jgi:hypothetical protein